MLLVLRIDACSSGITSQKNPNKTLLSATQLRDEKNQRWEKKVEEELFTIGEDNKEAGVSHVLLEERGERKRRRHQVSSWDSQKRDLAVQRSNATSRDKSD